MTAVYSKADVGCYADGTHGHAYIRQRLATLLDRLPTASDDLTQIDRYSVAMELRGDMSMDLSEEDDALEILQDHTADGIVWEFSEGGLMLTETERDSDDV